MPVVSDVLWEQLFGRTDRFAIRLSLGTSQAEPLGRIEVFTEGRCLTRNHHGVLGFEGGVTWNMMEFLSCLASILVHVVEPDDLPHSIRGSATAADWLVNTLDAGHSLDEVREERQFGQRYDYWKSHSLGSLNGVAFPDIVLRRVFNDIEVSWTTQLGNPRSDIRWLEAQGAVRLPAHEVLEPLLSAVRALAERLTLPHDHAVLTTIRALRIGEPASIPFSLAASGGVARLESADRKTLERLVQSATNDQANKPDITSDPIPPPLYRPWVSGYRLAQDYRELTGWGDGPIPDLEDHMRELGIDVGGIELTADTVHGLSLAGPGYTPTVRCNTHSKRAGPEWSRNILLAHELCHLRHDWRPTEDFSILSSDHTDWPTEARANAFGAELVMPSRGVTRVVKGRTMNLSVLEELMEEFKIGVRAATWHLRNIDQITDDERITLLQQICRR